MKHYSLKDKELLKRLNEIDRFFEQKLNGESHAIREDGGVLVNLSIGNADLEISEEFNPDDWNDFPAVTPPVNTWMRCMRKNKHGKLIRYCGQYVICGTAKKWVDEYDDILRDPDCFRLWNDD